MIERLRDRSLDSVLCLDDLSKHSKCYRQLSLILGKIASRDAFPADIFNVHSSLLERCSKLNFSFSSGSITGFPVIETINSDITEFIATNVISITDGQLYTSKRLFLYSIRPAIDSSLSVSRIGSNAQCKLVKLLSVGLKHLLSISSINSSTSSSSTNSSSFLISLFLHDFLFSYSLEFSIFLLLFLRLSLSSTYAFSVFPLHSILLFIIVHSFSLYLLSISFSFYSLQTFSLFTSLIGSFLPFLALVLTHFSINNTIDSGVNVSHLIYYILSSHSF